MDFPNLGVRVQFVLVATCDLIFSQYAPQLAILVLFLSEQSIIERIFEIIILPDHNITL